MLPCTSNHLFFCKLFGRNFCEQPIVLGKLLIIVKWSTFWVSFICVLTVLGRFQCSEIFKIDYLIISNMRFGSVSKCFHIQQPLVFLYCILATLSLQMQNPFSPSLFHPLMQISFLCNVYITCNLIFMKNSLVMTIVTTFRKLLFLAAS